MNGRETRSKKTSAFALWFNLTSQQRNAFLRELREEAEFFKRDGSPKLLRQREVNLAVLAVLKEVASAAPPTPQGLKRRAAKATRKFLREVGGSRPHLDDDECRSCRGYGYFDARGRATHDTRNRPCGDCRGTGKR